MDDVKKIKRALLSVSDKEGLLELARGLAAHGVELLSTGGTAKLLREAGVPVIEIGDYTGFPEIMGGRVKTLHPLVHGGILMDRSNEAHRADAEKNGIQPIDLVVVNLYPFQKTVSRDDVTEEQAIEEIDIGGVTLLRAAAKNFKDVTVVTASKDYAVVLKELEEHGGISLETRRILAIKAFEQTNDYDLAIAQYLKSRGGAVELLDLHYEKVKKLRYGENPHQKAVFFRDPSNHYPNVTNAKLLQDNKELSFNNILDVDAALKLVTDFERPTAVIIKHTNPCGVASAATINEAFSAAYHVDPMSAFGCVIGLNRRCTQEIAQYIVDSKLFVEIIAAPSFEKSALELLNQKKNMRLLETGELKLNPNERDIKTVSGGILVQNADQYLVTEKDLKVVTTSTPSEDQVRAMLFARKVVKHVKSNAVVFAQWDGEKGIESTVAIGAGQMSRVDSVFIARHKGGERLRGSVMASDAFFPFEDGVEEAHEAGVAAIIQPGGSIRDKEIIAKADELGLAMVFTGIRSFKH
ncbi:MAG: Bifunctional purine biosynthesis protein PurH [Candidatus Peregrinibacteria bacterium GW2011_GWA2_44_7]|nr:MAG: Bifunctional purine biosynthesis protein PurH [Candidatus Peregrinibacteria bacterium GW2011_GWA2_44_7]